MSVARQACKTVYAGSIPAVASTTTASESSPCKHRPLRRRFVGGAHRVGVPHRDCVTCDRDAAEVAVSRVDIAVAGPAKWALFFARELAMTIQQDVHDLKARLAALEHRLTGDRIHLRAGGTSLIIHPGGIDIESARLNITAGQSVQITAGSALAVTAGNARSPPVAAWRSRPGRNTSCPPAAACRSTPATTCA